MLKETHEVMKCKFLELCYIQFCHISKTKCGQDWTSSFRDMTNTHLMTSASL